MTSLDTLVRSIHNIQEGTKRGILTNTVQTRAIEPYKLFEPQRDRRMWRRALDQEMVLFLNAVITFDDGVVWDLRKGYKATVRYGGRRAAHQ